MIKEIQPGQNTIIIHELPHTSIISFKELASKDTCQQVNLYKFIAIMHLRTG